jgi:hypothetical protein
MPIKISAESLSAIKLGASDLTAAYVGDERVFPNDITVSYATPTGQSLTYTTPTTTIGSPGGAYSQTFTITGTSSQILATGSFAVAGLPSGLSASITSTGSGLGNSLTATITGVYPPTPALNIAMVISGITITSYTQYTLNYDSGTITPTSSCNSWNPNTLSYGISVANSINTTGGGGSITGYVPSFPQTVTYSISTNTATYAGLDNLRYYFSNHANNCDVCSLWGSNTGAAGTYQLSTTGNLTGGSTLYGGSTSRSWFLDLTGGGTSTISSNLSGYDGQTNGINFTAPAAGSTSVGINPTGSGIAIGQVMSSGGLFSTSCAKTINATATNGVRLYFNGIQTSGVWSSSQTIVYSGWPINGGFTPGLICDYTNAPSTGSWTLTVTITGPVYSQCSRTFSL